MKLAHVFSVLGACTAIALAAAACDDNHRHHGGIEYDTEDYCSQFATCDTCTPQNGCGWCFDGTNSFCGSDANQCSTDWTWETNFCHDAADASVSSGTTADASSTSSDASINADASGDDASSDAAQ